LDPELRNQISLLEQGYIELSPSFDPDASGVTLSNYIYNGIRFKLRLQRMGTKVKLDVESPKRLRFQFNQHWKGIGTASASIDEPAVSTPVFEIGGDANAFEVQLHE
jgi:hypothetical protein